MDLKDGRPQAKIRVRKNFMTANQVNKNSVLRSNVN